ncbi:MAG: hypothetical protein ACLFVK_04985 [Dehalococcoidia bacterium]
MDDHRQRELLWQRILGQAFLAASASVLFVTTRSSWCILGVDFFVILGIAFFLFSVMLLVSALGVRIKRLGELLSFVENTINWFWFAFLMIDIAVIISNWAVGKSEIKEVGWLSTPYTWSIPLWLILFTIILAVVGITPIVSYFRKDWQLATRQYSLPLAFLFALFTLAGIQFDVFTPGWILAFHLLTIGLMLVRIAVRS